MRIDRKADAILDGRRSFPSGHSSTAWAGMSFLFLWLAGKTAVWCFGAPTPPSSLRSSRLANLGLTFSPLLWATFVAVTRIQDYVRYFCSWEPALLNCACQQRHHKEDVIAGALIGLTSSTICYFIFWPNPFSSKNVLQESPGQPRLLYTDENRNFRRTEFELTRLEDDDSIETV